MRKKALLVVLVVLVAMTASLYAASVGSVGFVNYARLDVFESGDSEDYIPGIRGEFFLSDYLGVSADAMLLASSEYSDSYWMWYVIDAVARIPLGLVEPYAGVGFLYESIVIEGTEYAGSDTIGFNVRGGVDVNILEWLSVGAEVNYFVADLEDFFDQTDYYFSEEGMRNSGIIGVSAKFKF